MSKTIGLLSLLVILVGFGLTGADSAFAQEPGAKTEPAPQAASAPLFGEAGVKVIGGAIGAGLVIIGGATGISRLASAAVRSMARQPEVAGPINVVVIVTASMIEGALLFAVTGCFIACIK